MNIYVTSINKGGGKTMIAAGIAAVMQSLNYNACFYKPIQTGAIDKGKYLVSPDLTFVKMLDPYITTHSTYMTVSKAIPDLNSDINVNLEEIKRDYSILTKKTETIVVEAPCSLLTPINEEITTYQIPITLKIPVVFIVNPEQGAIGHYLAEINAAKSLGIDIAGVIINKFPVYSEAHEIKIFPSLIEKYCDIKV